MANSFTTAGVPTTMTLSGIATIENGDQTSAAIPNSGRAVVRLGFPTITSTTITFEVQAYPATGDIAAAEFRPLVDKDGAAISYTVGSDKIVTIPELSGCAAFKIVMGSDEASTRAIEVTSRGDNPVPFDGTGGGGEYPPGTSPLTPWYTAEFSKPDVTTTDKGGAWTTANSPIPLFTVTGLVMMRCVAVITASFTSTGNTGTVEAGTVGATTRYLAQVVANGTNLQTGFTWGAGSNSASALITNTGVFSANNAGTVSVTIATNNMTAGGIVIYCQWIPLSDGATVVAAA